MPNNISCVKHKNHFLTPQNNDIFYLGAVVRIWCLKTLHWHERLRPFMFFKRLFSLFYVGRSSPYNTGNGKGC